MLPWLAAPILLLLSAPPATLVRVESLAFPGPPVLDTTRTVTIRGVVLILNDPGGNPDRAVVLLAESLLLEHDRVWMLRVTGKRSRMERWSGRFVEATGLLTGTPPDTVSFRPTHVQEAEPDGAVRKEVDLSLSQHAVVTLAVVPDHFTVPPNGYGNRISPVILYKIANHGQTDLDFMFSNNEFVCVGLQREGDTAPRWTDTWKVSQPSPRLTIRIGSVFRSLLVIPPRELAWPDRYTVRASLCGVAEYATVAPLTVGAE